MSTPGRFPSRQDQRLRCDNGLGMVVASWDALPEAIRVGIVAMVRAATG